VSGCRTAAGPIVDLDQIDAQVLKNGFYATTVIIGHALQGTTGVK
jgi:hypothetical protein